MLSKTLESWQKRLDQERGLGWTLACSTESPKFVQMTHSCGFVKLTRGDAMMTTLRNGSKMLCPSCEGGRNPPEPWTDERLRLQIAAISSDWALVGSMSGRAKFKDSRIEFRHKCGRSRRMSPGGFLTSISTTERTCPHCSPQLLWGMVVPPSPLKRGRGRAPLTTEGLRARIIEVPGGADYEVVSECSGTAGKVSFKHLGCGSTFRTTANSFLNLGTRCPFCARTGRSKNSRKRLTIADFQCKVDLARGVGEYTIISYLGANLNTRVAHKCGHEWELKASMLVHARAPRSCPACKKDVMRDEFMEAFCSTFQSEQYRITGPYTASDCQITVRHLTCGTEWTAVAAALIRGLQTKCPVCASSSRLAMQIHAELKYSLPPLGVTSVRREAVITSAPTAATGFEIRFDFWIPELGLLIEADGAQHRVVAFPNGPAAAAKRSRSADNDKLKDAWAASEGLSLLRIPHGTVDIPEAIRSAIFSAPGPRLDIAGRGPVQDLCHKMTLGESVAVLDKMGGYEEALIVLREQLAPSTSSYAVAG